MSGYYLVARNRKDNSFQVIKLKESWYLGKKRGRDDVFTRENDLEAIDLVTTKFASEKDMAKRMLANGYITDSDVDIFIASKRKSDGKSYIKFEEVLYNPKKDQKLDSLRRVAYTSLQTDFRRASEDLNLIYDEAIATLYFADDFYDMLISGETNVSKSFAEQFRNIQMAEDIPYDLKQSDGFGAMDYASIRNMVEALNRLECFSRTTREDRYDKNREFIECNLSGRIAIVPDLSLQLDENYIEGQLSMFSLLSDDKKKVTLNASKDVALEIITNKKAKVEMIKINRNVSYDEKKKAVYRVLKSVPRNIFIREKDGTFKVNYSLFFHPLLEDEKKKLDSYLTGKLPEFFANYINNYANLQEAPVYVTPASEMAELQYYVDLSAQKINNRFKSSKCLNMAYEWCMLYDGCRKREEAYSSSDVCVSDDRQKVYGKKAE